MIFPNIGCWWGLQYQARIPFYGASLKANQRVAGYPIPVVTLLHKWTGWLYNLQTSLTGKIVDAFYSPTVGIAPSVLRKLVSRDEVSSSVLACFLCVLQTRCVLLWAIKSHPLGLLGNKRDWNSLYYFSSFWVLPDKELL